jgi:hypothetical protein
MRVEFEEGVMSIFPQSVRDDQVLEKEFQLHKTGDTLTLIRKEVPGSDGTLFFLQSDKVDVTQKNRAVAEKARDSFHRNVETEPESMEDFGDFIEGEGV